MSTTPKKRRGRPATHAVDVLRTRIWFNVVRMKSGIRSPAAIEISVDPEYARERAIGGVNKPRRWTSYENGDKVPEDKPDDPRNAVQQGENKYPGTAKWFRSQIWGILKEIRLDKAQIDLELRKISPAIVSILFEEAPREFETLPRQKAFDAKCMAQLSLLGSFESLEAAVLILELSDVIASPDLRGLALNLYLGLQEKLKKLPELTNFHQDLFSLLDKRFKHWIFVHPNQKMEVVMFWQGVPSEL